jgi:hypothetical protein
MNLKKREKILAIAFGSLLILTALYWLWPSGASLGELRAQRDELARKVDDNKTQALRAKKAVEQLNQWQHRALPADAETARSLYQNWLRELVDRAELRNFNISPQENTIRRDAYTLFSFTIKCQATLAELTKFLYEFYSVGILHKIRTITVTPINNSSLLNLNIAIEALSLPGATEKDKLNTESAKRLKLASLDAYKKVIVGRNLFAPYTPKSATDRNRHSPRNSDPARSTYLTGIVQSNGTPEAWFYVQSTGETIYLHEGDDFLVGSVQGKVMRIDRLEIEVQINGQNRTLRYGDSLAM